MILAIMLMCFKMYNPDKNLGDFGAGMGMLSTVEFILEGVIILSLMSQ